jgi:hypothetical protein
MPLGEVRAGMQCTGLSVVRGTAISSFDVEVLDVVADDPAVGGPRILVRASGPAIDSTGVGPGFSGSPILCDGRNVGAISEALGEYGNKVVLATPIQEILRAEPAQAGPAARRAPALLRSARPLAAPLTVSGLSERARRLLGRAADRSGRVVLAAPPGPLGGYPPQELRPGAAVAASLSTGDVSVGAVGTVAYRDGSKVFAFGHALDGVGPRQLFLQDAYVFAVIGNPLGIPDLGAITYKLTSSGGHPLGSITNDTFSAIAGSVGPEPRSIPLRVTARPKAGGSGVALHSRLADERGLALGSGLAFISPLAASTALDRLLGTVEPVTLSVCMRIRTRERRRPLGFCNPYFDGLTALTDIAGAAALVDGFELAPLHVEGVGVGMAVKRGVTDDVLVSATAPRRARAGSRLPVRLVVQRRGGGRHALTVRVPVPGDLRPGPTAVVLAGNGLPAEEEELVVELVEGLSRGQGSPARSAQAEPRTLEELARQIAAIRRPLGVVARFRHRPPRMVLRSNDVRFDGRVRVRLRVLGPRR